MRPSDVFLVSGGKSTRSGRGPPGSDGPRRLVPPLTTDGEAFGLRETRPPARGSRWVPVRNQTALLIASFCDRWGNRWGNGTVTPDTVKRLPYIPEHDVRRSSELRRLPNQPP